ncbi:MAG: glycosyltransferase family 39 protein, partial [Chloroflexota bacterium]
TSIEPTTSGDSALLQLAHMLSLTIFGNSEEAVRAPTAILGVLLVFAPLLFRDVLGATRTFVMVLALAFSPVMLASSRLDSPVVWQMVFALLALWMLKRHILERNHTLSTVAIVLFGAAALLTGTTGYLTVIMMIAAMVIADSYLRNRYEAYAEENMPLATRLREWSWIQGIGLAALIVLTTATAFMLYPPGLDALAQSIGSGLAGWFVPQEGAPFAFGLASSLFYEPLYWAFGLIGVILIFDRDEITFVDGFFVAWLAGGSVVALLYQGATAAHALWLTIPLAGLMSTTVLGALENESGMLWYEEDDYMNSVLGISIPAWARWVILGTSALLFSLVLMHVGWLSRALLTANFAEGTFMTGLNAIAAPLFFLTVMLLLFMLAGFSFASLYGGRETLRGGALGILIIGLFASLGGGWQVAVSRADDPRELWHTRAVGEEAFLLREQLLTLTERETEGFPALAVTIVTDDANVRRNDVLAWVLRDFENAQFVEDVSLARSEPVVITPVYAEDPDLGGNYVGQTVIVSRDWDASTLSLQGFGAWWYQRNTRVPPQVAQEAVLWLRQDIYDGVAVDGLQ